MNIARVGASIDLYFDGGLSAGELQELSALLEADSTARDYYWQRAKIHAALRGWGAAQAGLRQIAASDSAAFPAGEGSPALSLSKGSDGGSTEEVTPAIILSKSALGSGAKAGATTNCCLRFCCFPCGREGLLLAA